jgi:uncharacterized protein YrrD
MNANEIKIGAEVVGRDGKLGEVHRVIVDARSNHVTDLVVKHGFLWGNERVVPLGCVGGVEDGAVHLDLDEDGFKALNGFAPDHFHAPDPDYIGPPGMDHGEFLLNSMVATGGGAGLGLSGGTKPLGYPGGEQVTPNNMQRPAYAAGMDVLDAMGEKVGEIHDFAVDSGTGRLTRLVLRRGFLLHHDTELPLAWVENLGDDGLLLNVSKTQVEQLDQHPTSA